MKPSQEAPRIDVEAVRGEFPMFRRDDRRKPFHYLDSAASSQTPQAVIDAVADFYERYRANVHRGMYCASEEATRRYEGVRPLVARQLGAAEGEIVFTSGATHGLNLAAQLVAQDLRAGDEIVTTEMEHHANLLPWQQLARRLGLTVRYIPVRDDYTLDMAEARRLIGPQTKAVAFTWASNVLGTVNPAAELVGLARSVGAYSVVDAAQLVGHRPVDVAALGCDFLAFSAHKVFGPTGTGVLFGRASLLERFEPVSFGGDMIREVRLDGATWNDAPYKFEPGTPNIAGVIGMGAAFEFVERVGAAAIERHERDLIAYAFDRLAGVAGVRVFGPGAAADRIGAIAFLVEGVHPHDVATVLDAQGVCVRAGHHCAMPLHHRFGIRTGTARMSFGPYTAERDIDALIAGLHKAKLTFRV
jgi:cysteine desulfurase/selenocysteine lyase